MASFQKYKTKKGQRWMVQYYVKNPQTGKNVLKTKRGFVTKAEAVRFAENLKEDLRSGVNLLVKKTFEEVYRYWMAEEEKKWEESTIQTKKSKFNRILPRFSKLYIDEITEEYCQQFINDLEKELNLTTARDYGIQLNLVFKYARRKKLIQNNPMEFVVYSRTREENGESEDEEYNGFWSKDEVHRFLEVAKTHTNFRNYVLFRLALYSGLRKGELLSLREHDLIEETKEIYVRNTLYWKKGGEYKLTDPKTKKSKRKVKIDNETWELLQKLILSNNEMLLATGMRDIKDKFIFVREEFKPLRMAYPNDVLTSICRKYGFKEIKFHGLRHTHASMLFAAGATMKEIQERLGHSRIDITMNIYTHLTEDAKEEVQAKFIEYMTQDNSKNKKSGLISSKYHQKPNFS